MRQTQRGVAEGDRHTDRKRDREKVAESPRGRQSEGQRQTRRGPEDRGRGRRLDRDRG